MFRKRSWISSPPASALVHLSQVFFPAERALEDLLPFTVTTSVFSIFEPVDAAGGIAELLSKLVLAVRGKIVIDEHAAARAERQPVDVHDCWSDGAAREYTERRRPASACPRPAC